MYIEKVQTDSGSHPTSCCVGTVVLFQSPVNVTPRRRNRRGVTFTTDHPLVPRLRMSGGKPVIPLYAFMTWTGKLFLYKH